MNTNIYKVKKFKIWDLVIDCCESYKDKTIDETILMYNNNIWVVVYYDRDNEADCWTYLISNEWYTRWWYELFITKYFDLELTNNNE